MTPDEAEATYHAACEQYRHTIVRRSVSESIGLGVIVGWMVGALLGWAGDAAARHLGLFIMLVAAVATVGCLLVWSPTSGMVSREPRYDPRCSLGPDVRDRPPIWPISKVKYQSWVVARRLEQFLELGGSPAMVELPSVAGKTKLAIVLVSAAVTIGLGVLAGMMTMPG